MQAILANSASLKNILNLVKSITDRHVDYDSETFCKSDHFNFLKAELEKMRIP